jgi:hypothetical protein
MTFADTLEELERAQWEALKSVPEAVAFYSEFLTEDSRMAVPYGIGDRDRVIGSLETPHVILDFELKNTHVIKLSEDSGLIVYRMIQNRRGMEPFEAAISTVYVRREGRWRIAFHQQTPMATE